MSTDFLKREIEHEKKYKNLPLNKTPNFYLGRPLTKYEMECLRLIGVCESKSLLGYKNYMRVMVLSGHIPNIVKQCEQAHKNGYYTVVDVETRIEERRDRRYVLVNGRPIEHRVSFPPKRPFFEKMVSERNYK